MTTDPTREVIKGTPAITLGFTREEIDGMEVRAWPDSTEGWIHGLISAALSREIVYEHTWTPDMGEDAFRA